MNQVPPCVVVERLPFGSSSFTLAHCDQFDPDEVTVTCVDDGRVMQVFKPGTWLTATQYDSQGYPLAAFTSEEGKRRAAAAAAQFRELSRRYSEKGAA